MENERVKKWSRYLNKSKSQDIKNAVNLNSKYLTKNQNYIFRILPTEYRIPHR